MFENHPAARRALLALLPALAFPAAAGAQCPTAAQASASIQELFKRPGIEVKKVTPAAIKGLCEVVVSLQGRPNILYTDATGSYFVTGHLIDVKSGKDLTEETLSALNSLSAEEMKKVDALVAMTVGTKGPFVYFVTDPQ
ncbi:MAG TPA: disulfide isomerase DsbC N-terminal domain-containing protein [Candidatus Methanoperedens sp.]|nr:disulfide isomerase DsbC N-terminal domain-containing protein [Candidatus Methanoperedens sp.]